MADIRAIVLKGRRAPPQANQFLRAAKKKSPKGLDGSQETCYIMSCAKVAQSVEHSTENAGVAGSIPALGTLKGEARVQDLARGPLLCSHMLVISKLIAKKGDLY